jgi:EcoEI R protein C-terminal
VRGNPAGTLADIVMLVRYAMGQAEAQEPLPSLVAGRFNLWLGREEKAGRTYSDAQRQWLMAIRDHLGVNIEIRPKDMMDAPEFSARGDCQGTGAVRCKAAGAAGVIDGYAGGVIDINGIYLASEETAHERHSQTVHAWP